MKISDVNPNQEFRFPNRGSNGNQLIYTKLQAVSDTISSYTYLFSRAGTVYGVSSDLEKVILVDKEGKDLPTPNKRVKLVLHMRGQSPLHLDTYSFKPDVTDVELDIWAKLQAQCYKWDTATWEFV